MQDGEDARKTRELARRLAADRAARMLSPEQIAALRERTKRSITQIRAVFATIPRPNLDDPPAPDEGMRKAAKATGCLLVEYARRARLVGHVVPPWLVEEAWRFAWDAELGQGRLEEVEGAALRSLSLRVRKRARQMTRDTMDALYPPRR